jgi:hypothetical protein
VPFGGTPPTENTALARAELAEQTRAADEQLGDRIGSLVSAIGQFIATRQQ